MPALLFRCSLCSEMAGKRVDFEADAPKCPKCGAEAGIQPLVTVHLIYEEPSGPILGRFAKGFQCACDKRKVMTTEMQHREAFSDDARAVNCPACAKTAPFQAQAEGHRREEAIRQGYYNPPAVSG
jgi:ssDNA-binding Zn-finger/Zn-ribbon topoisomerase 1